MPPRSKQPIKLKPFFTYFGGKYRIAPKYPKPRYADIVEPFAGSAGYSIRYYNRRVHLYDINPRVFGTWNYLIKSPEKDILSLPLKFSDIRHTGICQEAQWLIGWWLCSGVTEPRHSPSSWMKRSPTRDNCTRLYTFWGEHIRQRIANQLQYIRHWKVYHASYEDMPNNKATYFVDPPYKRSGVAYTNNHISYTHLAEWSKSRLGQTIVCEQQGAEWLPFRGFLDARASPGSTRSGISKEMIWEGFNRAT